MQIKKNSTYKYRARGNVTYTIGQQLKYIKKDFDTEVMHSLPQ